MIFKRLKVERWSRLRRRKLVVVMYLSLAAFTVAGASISPLEDTVSESAAVLAGLTMIPAIFLFMAVFVTLRFTVQKLADEKEEDLDERQRRIRYQAHHRAYRILTWLLTIMFLYVVMVLSFPENLWLPGIHAAPYLFVAFIFLVSGLPTAVAAWTEPDPEPEGAA